MKTNATFKNEALAALKGNWTSAVLAVLLFALIEGVTIGPYSYQSVQLQNTIQTQMSGLSRSRMDSILTNPEIMEAQRKASGASSLYTILAILVIMPLTVGMTNAFHRLLTEKEGNVARNMFSIALDNYWHKVWGMLLMHIFISLWTLLLIIPGIIKAFSYAMTPYILEEFPELGANDAIDRSRAMMHGHKFDLFYLYLGFLGWGILSLFTAGIGFLWLIPYMETAQASFYEEVKADYTLNGGLI